MNGPCCLDLATHPCRMLTFVPMKAVTDTEEEMEIDMKVDREESMAIDVEKNGDEEMEVDVEEEMEEEMEVDVEEEMEVDVEDYVEDMEEDEKGLLHMPGRDAILLDMYRVLFISLLYICFRECCSLL
ncbi:histone chaperone ASF1-like [Geospiza fortis]|uniref:Histone chaperone ASF1-like n=1 Tax=Geospiza fortis TaxID=48883 RepID=A0A8N5ERT0_GEOFO|nr:histone chaperone ASF1-like [Geospiza fortis]